MNTVSHDNPGSYETKTLKTQFDYIRIAKIAWVVLAIALLGKVIFTYAFPSKTPLQMCQESYMTSVNAIYRENEKIAKQCINDSGNDIYKLNKCTSSPLPIPVNTCWIKNNSWTVAPAITGVPPKESVKDYLDRKHWQVCKKQPSSPLCKDKELFIRLYWITENRIPWKNWFPIMLGIINAESSLWTNFHPSNCGYTNNWWGLKWKKNDYWESIKDQWIPDKNGCWLYSYETVEDFWVSKTNTFRYGYKGCLDSSTPLACVSMCYVKGDCKTIKHWWVKNASIFLD